MCLTVALYSQNVLCSRTWYLEPTPTNIRMLWKSCLSVKTSKRIFSKLLLYLSCLAAAQLLKMIKVFLRLWARIPEDLSVIEVLLLLLLYEWKGEWLRMTGIVDMDEILLQVMPTMPTIATCALAMTTATSSCLTWGAWLWDGRPTSRTGWEHLT